MDGLACPHGHLDRRRIGLIRSDRVSAWSHREPEHVVSEVGLMTNEVLPLEKSSLDVMRWLARSAAAHVSSTRNSAVPVIKPRGTEAFGLPFVFPHAARAIIKPRNNPVADLEPGRRSTFSNIVTPFR